MTVLGSGAVPRQQYGEPVDHVILDAAIGREQAQGTRAAVRQRPAGGDAVWGQTPHEVLARPALPL